MRLGIVIPALNEQDAIAAVVAGCREHCPAPDDLRVVVCDNGSSDATAARAAGAGAVVVHESRRGYGAACLRALTQLGAWPDVLAFADGDGSTDLRDLPALLNPLRRGQAELVLGRRLAVGRGALTPAQRTGNALTCALLRLRFGARQRDLGPFRTLTRRALESLNMTDQTWGWTLEMQIKALKRGLRIAEVPVRWHPRTAGQSKISGRLSGAVRAGAKILWTFARHAGSGPRRPRAPFDEVLFFVKYPAAGQVKTRLAATLGDQKACRVYRDLAEHCHRALLVLEATGLAQVTMCTTGAHPAAFRRWLPGASRYENQADGDLGLRLAHAFDAAFARGARCVAAVGSDCPSLDAEAVSEAFGALQEAGAVVIPATDGGYVLLGLRRSAPQLFGSIDWSSARVMDQTRLRAAAMGLTLQELPALTDIDTASDLVQALPLIAPAP